MENFFWGQSYFPGLSQSGHMHICILKGSQVETENVMPMCGK